MIIYKSSMAGPYHIDNGIPCQDSYAVDSVNGAFRVAAVADGLGSETHSDIGSFVASKTAVEYASENLTNDMRSEDIKKVMNNAFVYAYKAVLERAAEDGNDSDEYDTTLCMAIYDGRSVYYGHSGDSGMVVLLETGDYIRVTTQQRDEEGRVFPLCWGPEKWEFGEVEEAVSAVMLATDGVFEQICPPLMRNHAIEVNVPLAQRFLDRFECSESDVADLEAASADYLDHFPRYLLDDDKTIVVMINPERKPNRKEESYYAIPDWNALADEAKARIANGAIAESEENTLESEDLQVEQVPVDVNDELSTVADDVKDTKGIDLKKEGASLESSNDKEVEESKKKDIWSAF